MSFYTVLKKTEEAFTAKEANLLLPLIKTHFITEAADPQYRPWFNASGMGYMCPRAEVFECLLPRDRPPTPPDLQAIFDIGHAIHERWQNHVLGPAGVLEGIWHCKTCGYAVQGLMPDDICPQCKSLRRCNSCTTKMGKGKYVEDHHCCRCQSESWFYEEYTVFNKEWQISGHLDGILHIGTRRIVWDLKTINDYGFTNRLKSGPLKPHVAQLQIYMWLKNKSEALIHYINKDTGKAKEFLIQRNDSYKNYYTTLIGNIRRHRAAGTLPDQKSCSSKYVTKAKECPWCKECFEHKLFKSAMERKNDGKTKD